VKKIITNNLVFEIFKAFTVIYQREKNILKTLVESESSENQTKANNFVEYLAQELKITILHPTSGGFCSGFFCNRKPEKTQVVSSILKTSKNCSEYDLINNIKHFLIMPNDTAQQKVNMIDKISDLITQKEKQIKNVEQEGGVLREGTRIGKASHTSSYAPSYAPHAPSYAPHAPSYAPHAPSYAPHAPSYAPHAPSYAQHAPSYAQHAPSYAQHTPSYAQHTPSYAPLGSHHSINHLSPQNVNGTYNNQYNSTQEFNFEFYSGLELELMDEIDERLNNLKNIHEFLLKDVKSLKKGNELVKDTNNPLTVGELLLIDANAVSKEIKELEKKFGKQFGNVQMGGGVNTTELIKDLYTFDVKTAKYEQMIAYRTYGLYVNIQQHQHGGGLGIFLTSIHQKFESYTVSEKFNALQSLGKSLIVYLFQRVLQKLKLPKEIAEFSVVENADEYFTSITHYITKTYHSGEIIRRKQNIYTTVKANDRQRQVTQMNIDIIDGLSGFATLISIFQDSSFENASTTRGMLSNLDFLIENLNKFKEALKNNNKITIEDIKKKILTIVKSFNPQVASADEYTSHKIVANAKRDLNKNIRGIAAYEQVIQNNNIKNAKLLEYERYRDNFKNKLGDDYNKFADDVDVMETIDLSQQLLIRISQTFTANHLTKEQLKELQEAGDKVLTDVMNTGFIKDTLQSVKTGFSSFLSSTPWIDSIIHILNLLAPFATTFGNIIAYTNPIGYFFLVINLSIVALHYLVRLSIFFWRKYAKQTQFNHEEFLQELKERTSVKQKGGRNVRYVSAKSKTKHATKGGAGFLPNLPDKHVRTSVKQVHDTMKSTTTHLPSIQGVKLPLIEPKNTPKQVNDNDDITILTDIAHTIVYDISKYSAATQKNYELTSSDISNMASALQTLITSDTVDINEVYSQSQSGGKPKRTVRKHLVKHTTTLQSKTKKDLIAHAKAKGVKVKSTDKKDDIIKAISAKKYKK
jgi:hypothetical protein